MELKDLNDDERLALVALVEVVVDSDAEVSDEELDKLDDLTEEIGVDLYEETADEVDRRFEDEDALRAFLPTIVRQDARDLIYGTVLETVLVDAIDAHENDLLTWLAKTWDVTVQTGEPES